MGRALKILAYAVILFLTYLLITATLKTCSKSDNDVASAEIENSIDEGEGFEDDYFEDGIDEIESTTADEEDDFFGATDSVEDIDYEEIDQALEGTKQKKSANPTPDVDYTTPSVPERSTTSSLSSGNYLVIAGSYIINTNAENMVLKLKRMGYDNAEIVIFDQSQYHTVVAQRSNNYNNALSIASGLKSKGVDSYVHTKKD